ncbi:hypothetical protein OG689_10760 [Kitasatospora sp. NBC_00240]|uniref:hypothetical protein n=1 Tax=Kitasatospora sp. NBC_00240 TaxID=2903567 RepID=UPI002251EAE7|nr:hypothetical protein [Kitasatospora sp. NBC_00240]MCX5209764.1 hypothetical protein [Kitasatospora sp. NBC_00240]
MTNTLPYDRTLAALASLADTSGVQVGITLTTVGGVITGRLISSTRWAELNIETLKATDKNHNAMVLFYETYRDKFAAQTATTIAVQDSLQNVELPDDYMNAIGNVSRPLCIHLEGARFVGGDGSLSNKQATPWRGRLSEVVGWSLGELVLKGEADSAHG